MQLIKIASFVAGLALSVTALAQVKVSEPWVRGTVAPQKVTGAFMELSAEQDVRLVQVKSSVAGTAEIHEMKMDNNVMKMQAIESLPIAAGKSLSLKPGSYHIMLFDLNKTLANDEQVPITLVFEDKAKKRFNIDVKAVVKPLAMKAH